MLTGVEYWGQGIYCSNDKPLENNQTTRSQTNYNKDSPWDITNTS